MLCQNNTDAHIYTFNIFLEYFLIDILFNGIISMFPVDYGIMTLERVKLYQH